MFQHHVDDPTGVPDQILKQVKSVIETGSYEGRQPHDTKGQALRLRIKNLNKHQRNALHRYLDTVKTELEPKIQAYSEAKQEELNALRNAIGEVMLCIALGCGIGGASYFLFKVSAFYALGMVPITAATLSIASGAADRSYGRALRMQDEIGLMDEVARKRNSVFVLLEWTAPPPERHDNPQGQESVSARQRR